MKEYINKTTGEYRKTSEVVSGDNWITIPDGADAAIDLHNILFYKNNGEHMYLNGEQRWCVCSQYDRVTIYEAMERGAVLLWQRPAKPEALPFVDDEPSLNDHYAEIEKVRQTTIADTLAARQATYGSFEDVAHTTQELLDVMRQYGFDSIGKPHKEALHMICSKMARIVNGDHNHKDSWHDIGGYAKLIEDLID